MDEDIYYRERIVYELLRMITLLNDEDRRYIKEHIWLKEDGNENFIKKYKLNYMKEHNKCK